MKTNRREFTLLGATSILGAVGLPSTFGAEPLSAAEPMQTSARTAAKSKSAAATSEQPWYQRIRRIGQTNFNERDPQYGNVEKWADYWASAKVEAVALSVSGPVAFYPTAVPFFHRSKYLNGRDLFGECVTAAKTRGIRVFGRMSPDIQYTDPKLLAAHPLWFRRNQDGSLQQSAPEIAFTCTFNGQFSTQQPAILRELNERYDIDGVYMNGWPVPQVCYCETCQKIGDPHSDHYRAAFMDRVEEMIDLYKSIVLEKSPNNFYSCNLGGGLKETGLDQWRLTRHSNWYTADNQSRQAVVAPVWEDAQQVKFARALMGNRPVAAVSGSYIRAGRVMWRNVSDTSAEVECRMAQTAAAGGVVWYHFLGMEQGFVEDRRWQAPGREFLSWHAKHDRHFHNLRSLARVAIVTSSKSVTVYKAPYTDDKTDHIEGMYTVLTEARIPFDFVHENDLNESRLAQYTVVILPNMALMSDGQAAALRAYAERGGSLLATFETGLYDENNKPRDNFALASLFGIDRAGAPKHAVPSPQDPMSSVHLQSLKQRGPINAGFEDTEWIGGPVWSVPLKSVSNPVATVIEPYPVYPPESVYMREPITDMPSVVVRETGNARLAYFAGDNDASYWRLDNLDLGRQLTNTIRWMLRDTNCVTVDGDGLIEVFAWETEVGFAVHMVNYNGPNAFRGRMRYPVTLGPQRVRLNLPRDAKVRNGTLLKAQKPLTFQQKGRSIEFTVPALQLYEVAAFEV